MKKLLLTISLPIKGKRCHNMALSLTGRLPALKFLLPYSLLFLTIGLRAQSDSAKPVDIRNTLWSVKPKDLPKGYISIRGNLPPIEIYLDSSYTLYGIADTTLLFKAPCTGRDGMNAYFYSQLSYDSKADMIKIASQTDLTLRVRKKSLVLAFHRPCYGCFDEKPAFAPLYNEKVCCTNHKIPYKHCAKDTAEMRKFSQTYGCIF